MQFHNLKKNSSNRKAKQVGRGGSRGKTSGRGTKGQNARSGRKKRPEWRDIIKRLPKLRGRGKNSLKTRLDEAKAIKLGDIEKVFEKGATISPATLVAKELVSIKSGVTPRIKILVGGELTKNFNFIGVEVSAGARTAIESLGGKVSKEE